MQRWGFTSSCPNSILSRFFFLSFVLGFIITLLVRLEARAIPAGKGQMGKDDLDLEKSQVQRWRCFPVSIKKWGTARLY